MANSPFFPRRRRHQCEHSPNGVRARDYGHSDKPALEHGVHVRRDGDLPHSLARQLQKTSSLDRVWGWLEQTRGEEATHPSKARGRRGPLTPHVQPPRQGEQRGVSSPPRPPQGRKTEQMYSRKLGYQPGSSGEPLHHRSHGASGKQRPRRIDGSMIKASGASQRSPVALSSSPR